MADAVRVEGLKELRKALKQAEDPKAWGKELGRANRVVAREVAGWAQAEASSLGGPYAHFASAISGKATQAAARVEIRPVANAVFWGAKKRTGWNAGHDGAPQHPKWVGVSWEVGGPGGPYALNPAISQHSEVIVDRMAGVIDGVFRSAFPD